MALVIIDVDKFKIINDKFGHPAGDKVLKFISKILRQQVRESDFLARYGGEEFVLLLPDARLTDAANVAEKLRKYVEQCNFHNGDKRVPITVSCGIARFDEEDTPESVLDRADASLYQAKASGRNCSFSEGQRAAA